MDKPLKMLNRWGEDVTPLCADPNYHCRASEIGRCKDWSCCPGFYEGCYRDWRRMKFAERAVQIRHSV